MTFIIERHYRPEGELDMTRIKVAKATYYLHDGRAYKRGTDVPSGASLLVREGSPILPEVAERYGIETETVDNVARVVNAGAIPKESRGVGVSSSAEENYRRIDAVSDVHAETVGINTSVQNAGAGAGRQAAMLRSEMVEERVRQKGVDGSTQVIEPGTEAAREVAAASSGIGNAPINPEITKQLEKGEIAATARHTSTARNAAQGGDSDLRAQETSGEGIKPGSVPPEGAGTTTSVSKDISPGGDDTAAKLAAEAKAKAEAEAKARAEEAARQETATPPAVS